jgi:hypothetical protein
VSDFGSQRVSASRRSSAAARASSRTTGSFPDSGRELCPAVSERTGTRFQRFVLTRDGLPQLVVGPAIPEPENVRKYRHGNPCSALEDRCSGVPRRRSSAGRRGQGSDRLGGASGPGGAVSLTLASNLSFIDDSSSDFPIRGANLGDSRIASDRPTAIFFGTSHCWNTNREAERFVALYALEGENARFLVVDLERPSAEQRALVSRFYRRYIPMLAFLDRFDRVIYNEAGETANDRGDISRLGEILRKASSLHSPVERESAADSVQALSAR